MSSKKHQKSGTVQEEGLTNEGRHHLLLLHKQAHHIVGSLHVYVNRIGLTGHIPTLENMPTPLFEEQLKFIAHGS